MYSTFDHWAYFDHLLPMLTMCSPCTHWVFGPSPPVRAETRLRTTTTTTKTIARLRARNEHDREWGKLTQGELVVLCVDMTDLYTSIRDLRR
jgi:hypothetical protein